MSVVREMFDRVEQEHRTKLEQLQKMQDEQRYELTTAKFPCKLKQRFRGT